MKIFKLMLNNINTYYKKFKKAVMVNKLRTDYKKDHPEKISL